MPRKGIKIYDDTCKYCKKKQFEFVTVDDGEEIKEMKLNINHQPCLFNAMMLVEEKIYKLREKLIKIELERNDLMLLLDPIE